MIKDYVLDTNVLLYDPNSINMFEDNNICIPMIVLEELDTFKKDKNELGINARTIIRILDKMRSYGKLSEGVELKNGGKLFVLPSTSLKSAEKPDNKLLEIASSLNNIKTNRKTIIITKDINLRVKANAIGIDSQDYKKPSEGNEEQYCGIKEITCSSEFIDKAYAEGRVEIADSEEKKLLDNQYIIIKSDDNEKQSAVGRVNGGELTLLKNNQRAINIFPKNLKQRFALDALMDPDIKLVTMSGKSGTGKTLLAVAAGIHQMIIDKAYESITVTRPIVSVGKEIGFLPGDVEAKISPWMHPIYDAIDFIIESDKKRNKTELPINLNLEELIQIAPLSYIRGRSFYNSYMIIDESQNLSPLEVKTIITRAGQQTKIVLTGDVYQIDDPYLNSHSNGLSQLIMKFKGKGLYAHVTLTDGERSPLAEMAANIL